jgi:hypothetical protein
MRTATSTPRDDDIARCRLRIGPGSNASLEDEGVAILELEGVRSVALDPTAALVVDFDPRLLAVADLVEMLEFAGVIGPGIAWSVHPRAA